VIKGQPAQTFLRPDRQWMSGQSGSMDKAGLASASEPSAEALAGSLPQDPGPEMDRATNAPAPARIFYYRFFDPDRNLFANLTVFEFDPVHFTLRRRIFAGSARWDARIGRWIFENGWERTFVGEATASYQPFLLKTFPEIRETPAYFKKEDRQSQEMSFGELSAYIEDLSQSGFDTRRLNVQLNTKIAYPAITLVMAFLAVPFALKTGKRGGVAGFAIAILLAVIYLGVSSLFEAMGDVNTLPAVLAAWSPDLLFAFAGAYFLLRTPT
jgi:lipopolysaccharide export LptBFGC system permease protein LptF